MLIYAYISLYKLILGPGPGQGPGRARANNFWKSKKSRKNMFFVFRQKLILDQGFRASRYHHEQELDESFLMVVFSFNFDKLEWSSCPKEWPQNEPQMSPPNMFACLGVLGCPEPCLFSCCFYCYYCWFVFTYAFMFFRPCRSLKPFSWQCLHCKGSP